MEPAIDDSRPLIEQRDASVRPLSKEKETLHVAVRPVIPNKRSISNPKAAKADIPTKSIPEKVKPK
jgi:hypothetical protein